MKTPEEIAAEMIAAVHRVRERNGNAEGLAEVMSSLRADRESDFEAAVRLLMECGESERQTVMYLATEGLINVPEDFVRDELQSGQADRVGRAIGFCRKQNRIEYAPELIALLELHHKDESYFSIARTVVDLMLDMECPEFVDPLQTWGGGRLYGPNQTRFFRMLENLGVGCPRRPLQQYPAENWGMAMPGHTPPAFGATPVCPCCKRPMLLLTRLPAAIDPLEWPLYHCLRCIFDSPIYLRHSEAGFEWLDQTDNYYDLEEMEEPDTGGHILWGIDPGAQVDGPPPPGDTVHCARQRTHVGGAPEWLQSGCDMVCVCCSLPMAFLMQLQSDYTFKTRFYFLYGGQMFVFRCERCRVTGYYFECT